MCSSDLEEAERFFALTEGDNRNILAAQLASRRFSVPSVIAKINDPVRAEAYAALGIGTVCRTTMMVESIAGYLGLAADGGACRVIRPSEDGPAVAPDREA